MLLAELAGAGVVALDVSVLVEVRSGLDRFSVI